MAQEDHPLKMKQCTKCKNLMESTDFYSYTGDSWCKFCMREYDKERRNVRGHSKEAVALNKLIICWR